ncbi:MAG: peptide-methionine (S)-S-oxide reductase [Flavobacteriaceae bacterium]
MEKIGFGGGCHWCTEAVFQHLTGVDRVEQGWIAPKGTGTAFSEAVIVHFLPDEIPLEVLCEIHLRTHRSTSDHTMRQKYRSGIYTFTKAQQLEVIGILEKLQLGYGSPLVTKAYPFKDFRASDAQVRDYYKKNPGKPFCETYISPKLRLLLKEYGAYAKKQDLKHLSV